MRASGTLYLMSCHARVAHTVSTTAQTGSGMFPCMQPSLRGSVAGEADHSVEFHPYNDFSAEYIKKMGGDADVCFAIA